MPYPLMYGSDCWAISKTDAVISTSLRITWLVVEKAVVIKEYQNLS